MFSEVVYLFWLLFVLLSFFGIYSVDVRVLEF